MKRIIEGVAYNTDTSTIVARDEITQEAWGGNPQEFRRRALYQTRGGAFFVHHLVTTTIYNRATREREERERHEFEPLSRDEAQAWILSGDVELLNEDALGDPPEAVDEAAPSATLYIRLPAALKDRIDAKAKEQSVSLNAWATRCVERCADFEKVGAHLGEIFQTGMKVVAEKEDGSFADQHKEMFDYIVDNAIDIAMLLGWDDEEMTRLYEDEDRTIRRPWTPSLKAHAKLEGTVAKYVGKSTRRRPFKRSLTDIVEAKD